MRCCDLQTTRLRLTRGMGMSLSQTRIEELEKAEQKLNALEAGGVDNWDGYDDSLVDFRKDEAIEECIDDALSEVIEVLANHAYEPSERGAGFAFHEDAEKEALIVMHKAFRQLLEEIKD